MTYLGIILTLVFGSNVVLTYVVGLWPAAAVSRSSDAVRLGAATTVATVASGVVAWLLYRGILVPLGATYLRTIVATLAGGGTVVAINAAVRRFVPSVYRSADGYLDMVTTNCAVVGITLIAIRPDARFVEAALAGLAGGAGFFLAVILLTTIREQLAIERVPKAFRGTPIVLISAGLAALAFLAFDRVLLSNLVR